MFDFAVAQKVTSLVSDVQPEDFSFIVVDKVKNKLARLEVDLYDFFKENTLDSAKIRGFSVEGYNGESQVICGVITCGGELYMLYFYSRHVYKLSPF